MQKQDKCTACENWKLHMKKGRLKRGLYVHGLDGLPRFFALIANYYQPYNSNIFPFHRERGWKGLRYIQSVDDARIS